MKRMDSIPGAARIFIMLALPANPAAATIRTFKDFTASNFHVNSIANPFGTGPYGSRASSPINAGFQQGDGGLLGYNPGGKLMALGSVAEAMTPDAHANNSQGNLTTPTCFDPRAITDALLSLPANDDRACLLRLVIEPSALVKSPTQTVVQFAVAENVKIAFHPA